MYIKNFVSLKKKKKKIQIINNTNSKKKMYMFYVVCNILFYFIFIYFCIVGFKYILVCIIIRKFDGRIFNFNI